MNKKFKFLTVLLALVMTLGAFAPFSARAEEETTEKVTIHKILMTKKALSDFNAGTTGNDGTKYDGNKIENIQKFFDTSAKEIDGVYFKLQKLKDEFKDADFNDKNVRDEYLKDDTKWTDVENLHGLTKDGIGLTFETKGFSGKFRIVEDHEKSTYKGEDGETLTGSKAVPTFIILPLVNEKGVVKEAHVYPKNTEEKPLIDKNFKKDNDLKEEEAGETGSKAGADYNNYKKEKAKVSADLGKDIPYEVKTKLPKDAKYKTLKWADRMTEGLTFNNDLDVQGLPADFKKGTDYTVTVLENGRGFDLAFTDAGLEKLKKALAEKEIEVTLTYSAKINEKAVVDIPELNDIRLHYGNDKSYANEPTEVKPKDKKIEVKKSWDVTGDDTVTDADKTAKVTYILQKRDEKTNVWTEVERVTKNYNEENPQTSFNHTFENLDDKLTYRVIEEVEGYEPEYLETKEDGTVSIKNHKSSNPKPLDPTEPKVVLGGKRFVKTNNENKDSKDLKKLAGAEFYVKNSSNKYLVASKKDAKAVSDAKAARDEAIKKYNELKADEQTQEEKDKVFKLQNEYIRIFKENATAYTWGEKNDPNVVILTSDSEGRFEITGLKYGDYKLEELKAPKDYATLSGDEPFVVGTGSYEGKETDIEYKLADDTIKHGQQIKNKKVSIPQTGGIGTVIFTVVGVMLMVGAAFALKRRKEDELEGLA